MTSDKRKIEPLTAYATAQGITLEELGAKIESSIVNDNELGRRTPEEIEALFKKPEETIVEGWVLRDDNNEIGIYRGKPTCDEDGYWDLSGESYDLFPDISSETEPKRYRITITPID